MSSGLPYSSHTEVSKKSRMSPVGETDAHMRHAYDYMECSYNGAKLIVSILKISFYTKVRN